MRSSDLSSDVCSSDLYWPDLFSTNIAIQYGAIKRDRLRFFFCQNQCFGYSHGRIAQRFQKILQHHADHRLVFNDEYCLSVSHFAPCPNIWNSRSEEQTSELQSLIRNSYAVFCLKKNKNSII